MLISLAVWGGQAHALGLGAITLQSGLGQPLQVKIPVYGLTMDDAGAVCLKSRVLALDGSLLARPAAELTGSGAGLLVSLRSVENISEPAVHVSVEIGCSSAVRREYQLLLDPLPATLTMASSATTERVERAGLRAASQAGAIVLPPQPAASTAKAPVVATTPASVARKQAAPIQPKPPAGPKNVLTLTGGNAEIEPAGSRIVLRSATGLSEPRVETDPAKLAALRADQASVAALLRSEDLLAGVQAQLGDTQSKLLATQIAAASAVRRNEQERAALLAAQEDMVSGKLATLLASLLLACVAIIGWLLWRRAADQRRQEQAFFAMTANQDAPAAPALRRQHAEHEARLDVASPVLAPPAAPATPPVEPVFEAEPVDFIAPVTDFAPAPAATLPHQAYDWHVDAAAPAVSLSFPEPLRFPESWLAIENHLDEIGKEAPPAMVLPPARPAPDDNAQAHAAEVAGMLLVAENWMAEHNPLRAAKALRPYFERDNRQSPAPGLYLLSLYRTMDNTGQIAPVLAQLQQDFPAEATAWSNHGQSHRSMADFPAVRAAVDSLSDTDELLPYLNSLLLAPEAFDFSTYRDIVRAIGLAHEMKQENGMESMSLDFH